MKTAILECVWSCSPFNRRHTAWACATAAMAAALSAAPPAVPDGTADDPSFPGELRRAFPDLDPPVGPARKVVRDSAGRWHIARQTGILRLLADGTPDPEFDAGALPFGLAELLPDETGGGIAVTVGPQEQFVIGYAADGSRDASFAENTFWRHWLPIWATDHGQIHAAVRLEGGRVLVAGEFAAVGTNPRSHLVVLNPDGSVADDLPFGTAECAPNGGVHALLRVDQHVYLAGDFTAIGPHPAGRIARVNLDGTPDLTWSVGAGADRVVQRLVRQPDGRLLALGRFVTMDGQVRRHLARLETDGSVDTSFDLGQGVDLGEVPLTSREYALGYRPLGLTHAALNEDGSILVAGLFTGMNGWPNSGLVRLQQNGRVDTQWASRTTRPLYPGDLTSPSLHEAGGGTILVTSWTRTRDGDSEIDLWQPVGGPAPELPPRVGQPLARPVNQLVTHSLHYYPVILPAQAGTAVAIASQVAGPGDLTLQWFRDGEPLTDSATVSGVNKAILHLYSLRSSDVGAYHLRATSSITGSTDSATFDLTVDPEFPSPGGLALDWAADPLHLPPTALAAIPEGGWWVAVDQGSLGAQVYRLDAHGRILPHSEFSTATGANRKINAIAPLTDGRVLIGGSFNTVQGKPRPNMAILQSNGLLDSILPPAVTGWMQEMHRLDDGRIVVLLAAGTGAESEQPEAFTPRIIRLLGDGTLDDEFLADGHGVYRIHTIAPMQDGRVVVAGKHSNGVDHVIRLGADGSPDPTFAQSTFEYESIFGLALDPEGGVVVVGDFLIANGRPARRIVRLNPDGSLDPTFGPTRSPGPAGEIARITRADDGHFYLLFRDAANEYGLPQSFPSYDGFELGALVRLDSRGVLDPGFPAPGAERLRTTHLPQFVGLPANTKTPLLLWQHGRLLLAGHFLGYSRGHLVQVATPDGPTHPPAVLEQTGHRKVARGVDVTLQATFSGGGPYTYEWRLNGTPVPEANGPRFDLGRVGPNQTGTYTVTATNALGSATATMEVTTRATDPLAPVEGVAIVSGFQGRVTHLLPLPDGQVVVGGSFHTVDDRLARLVRLRADGQIDPDFNFPDGPSGGMSRLIAEASGSLLLHGSYPFSEGQAGSVLRLAPDGSVSAVLVPSNASPAHIGLQPDGKIVVVRLTGQAYAGGRQVEVSRLLPHGEPDPAFVPAHLAVLTEVVPACEIDSAGNILLSGDFLAHGAQPIRHRILRLLPNGNLDTSWHADPRLQAVPSGLFISRTGSVYAWSNTAVPLAQEGASPLFAIRLAADGMIDTSWICDPGAIHVLGEDAAGTIHLARTGLLERLLPDGRTERKVPLANRVNALVGVDDRLLVAGGSDLTSINGESVPGIEFLASTAPPTPRLLSMPPAAQELAHGQTFVLGAHISYPQGVTFQWYRDGEPIDEATGLTLTLANATAADAGLYHLVVSAGTESLTIPATRITVQEDFQPAGSIDLDWGPGQQIRGIRRSIPARSGHVFLVGDVIMGTNATDPVVLIEPTGLPFEGFRVSPRVSGSADDLLELADGRLLVTGKDLRLDGNLTQVVRLHPNGELDSSFVLSLTSSSLTGRIWTLQELASGRIAALVFTGGGWASGSLVILEQDGAQVPGLTRSYNIARDLIRGPDHTVWLIAAPDNQPSPCVHRILTDGSIDPDFRGPELRQSEGLMGATSAPDGDLYVLFRIFNGNDPATFRIMRLDAEGNVASHVPLGRFAVPSSPKLRIHADGQGRLLTVGNFWQYDGIARNGIVRLLPDGAADPSFLAPPLTKGHALPDDVELAILPGRGRILLWGTGLAGYGGISQEGDLLALHEQSPIPAPPLKALEHEAIVDLVPYDTLSIGLPAHAPHGSQIQWFRNGFRLDGESGPRIRQLAVLPEAAGHYHATVSHSGSLLATSPIQVRIPRDAVQLHEFSTRISLDRPFARAAPLCDGNVLVAVSRAVVNEGRLPQLLIISAEGNVTRELPTVILSGTALSTPDVMLADPQGRIYLGGTFTTVDGIPRSRLARLLPDGALDPDWNPGAEINGQITCMDLDTEGRLLIGGSFTQVGGVSSPRLARLDVHGARDATFEVGTGLSGKPLAMLLQQDGSWIIGGEFTTFRGSTAVHLIRLSANGTRDSAFAPAPNNSVASLAPGPGGSVYAGGNFTTIGGQLRYRLARILSNGAIDSEFAPHVGGATVQAITIDADDRILVEQGAVLRRFHPNGSSDATLPMLSISGSASINRVIPQADSILVTGTFSHVGEHRVPGLAWVRAVTQPSPLIQTAPADRIVVNGLTIHWSASLSDTAGVDSYRWIRSATGETLSTADNLTLATVTRADSGWYRLEVVRQGVTEAVDFRLDIAPDREPPRPGEIVPNFIPNVPAVSPNGLAAAGDDYLWVRRGLTLYRLLPDGSVEPPEGVAFHGDRLFSDGAGRLIASGWLYGQSPVNYRAIHRLLPDAVIDPSFQPFSLDGLNGRDYRLEAVLPQPDGGILVALYPAIQDSNVPASRESRIYRLQPDGTLNSTFVAAHPNGRITSLTRHLDDRILVVGAFDAIGTLQRNRLVRLMPDGGTDPTFHAVGVPEFAALAVLPDQRILIGGDFIKVDGLRRPGMACLFPDGSIDPSFAFLGPPSFTVHEFLVRPDGRILASGRDLASPAASRIFQFFADGTLDREFDTSLGMSQTPSLHLLPDGNTLIYQDTTFTTSSGLTLPGLGLQIGTPLTTGNLPQVIDFPTPANLRFSLEPIPLVASASSGLPVTLQVTAGPASLTASSLVATGTGSVTVVASQPGNSIHLPAEPVVRTFTILPGVDSWRAAWFTPAELGNPTIGDLHADPDGDGRVNLIEYALGSSPFLKAGPPLEIQEEGDAWLIRFSRPTGGVPGVEVIVEITTDHNIWNPVPLVVESTTASREFIRAELPKHHPLALARLRVNIVD